jgi:DNA-binding YbaB/EbfC family protein
MNIQKMLKQAQQMQAKMEVMQQELADQEEEGSSGGGAVKIVLSGKYDMKSIKLDKSLVDPEEVDVLEDLIVAAFNDAKKKVDDLNARAMSDATGGMKLPF